MIFNDLNSNFVQTKTLYHIFKMGDLVSFYNDVRYV